MPEDIDPREDQEPGGRMANPNETTVDVPIDDSDPEKVLKIGSQLDPVRAKELTDFLKDNLDVFAWTHADMCGISPSIMSHSLSINPKHPTVKHKRRMLGPERSAALKEEVGKLKSNGFIRDSTYPDWISNPVLVKKANGKWPVSYTHLTLPTICSV